MDMIEWEDRFSIGIAEVDHEHKELIQLINDACKKLLQDNSEDSGVEEFLGEIYAKISAHFALEEHVMRDRHYDQIEWHKESHESLLDDIRDIMDDYELSGDFSQEDFAKRLQEWFGTHFNTLDARFHGHMN